jgi:hypothetical protein
VIILLNSHSVHVSKAAVRLVDRPERRLRLENPSALALEINLQEQV